ncbi:hypothetical protein HMPREF0262_01555 [Clostridium sp. ATCC 29733]|nr:hypothetical protein HMPREF0262_01555 [Clostridium sp. ATCC 29733]
MPGPALPLCIKPARKGKRSNRRLFKKHPWRIRSNPTIRSRSVKISHPSAAAFPLYRRGKRGGSGRFHKIKQSYSVRNTTII